jgi:hypothetical protein
MNAATASDSAPADGTSPTTTVTTMTGAGGESNDECMERHAADQSVPQRENWRLLRSNGRGMRRLFKRRPVAAASFLPGAKALLQAPQTLSLGASIRHVPSHRRAGGRGTLVALGER